MAARVRGTVPYVLSRVPVRQAPGRSFPARPSGLPETAIAMPDLKISDFAAAAPADTVVAFSCARFTPADVAAFGTVAEAKLREGHWVGVVRETGRDHDRLLVLLPGVERPVFRFQRDRDGRYSLSFNDRSGWYGIGAGGTAAECLSIWRPRRARPGAAL